MNDENDSKTSLLFDFLTGGKGWRVTAIILLFVIGAAFMAEMARAQESTDVPEAQVEEVQEPEESFWESWSMGWRKMFTDKEEIELRLTQLQEYEQQLEDREAAIARIEQQLDFNQHEFQSKAKAYRQLTLEHLECSHETLERLDALVESEVTPDADSG